MLVVTRTVSPRIPAAMHPTPSFRPSVLAASLLVGTLLAPAAAGVQAVSTAHRVNGLTAEQAEILSHLSIVYLDDGQGGTVKTLDISGINVRIHNGLGATNGYPADPDSTDPKLTATNGLGNLIVGYNEPGNPDGDDRTGSHNFVFGHGNSFSSFGGLVGPRDSTISAAFASVSGGGLNRASAVGASVSGGRGNLARERYSSVSAGKDNLAWSAYSSVSGGRENWAADPHSSISGGVGGFAGGYGAAISGGFGNFTNGAYCSISGGLENEAGSFYTSGASVSGGWQNSATGSASSVSGGTGRSARGSVRLARRGAVRGLLSDRFRRAEVT